MVPEAPEMPTMSRAAVLAIPALVPHQRGGVICHGTTRRTSRSETSLECACEAADQNLDGLFRELAAHRALIGADIGARGVFWRRLSAERARPGEFVERFLLQFFGVELHRLDLVAKRFLLARIEQCRRAFELAARVADRNDREL